MVILAVRSCSVVLASTVTVMLVSPASPEVLLNLHHDWSAVAVHSLLVVKVRVISFPSASAVNSVVPNVTLSSSTASFLACLIVASAVAVPAVMVILAVRSWSVVLASRVRVMVEVPDEPELLLSLHQVWSEEAVHSLLVVKLSDRVPSLASAVKFGVLTVASSGSGIGAGSGISSFSDEHAPKIKRENRDIKNKL